MKETRIVVPIVVDVPPETRTQFKTACASQGKTMSDVVRDFVQKYVERKKAAS